MRLVVFLLFLLPIESTVAETVLRTVAAPNYIATSNQAANAMFAQIPAIAGSPFLFNSSGTAISALPTNRWYLVARHQGSNSVRYKVSYTAAPNTGLTVPAPVNSWQRGLLANTTPQTTYQLYQYGVGLLNLSWNYDGFTGETHPQYVPPCDPTICRGINKHVAYSYDFSPGTPVFTNPNNNYSSLALQADELRVTLFQPYDYVTGDANPTPYPIGELYWVAMIGDAFVPDNVMQLVVYIYRNQLPPPNPAYNGEERINTEFVGSIARPVLVSSMTHGTYPTKKFVEVRPDSAVAFQTIPWASGQFSRVHITPSNLKAMIGISNWVAANGCTTQDCYVQAVNANAQDWCVNTPNIGQFSCDLTRYRLNTAALLQEIQYERGDQVVMGSYAKAPAVYELQQP